MGRPPLAVGTYGEIRAYPVKDQTWRAVTLYRDYDGVTRPVALDVELSGRTTLVGYFVGRSGSVRPISRVFFSGGRLRFSGPAGELREDPGLLRSAYLLRGSG